jgi:diguanylate cyclase (GGDEF)-like protein/PAS domain S-box-containing protein
MSGGPGSTIPYMQTPVLSFDVRRRRASTGNAAAPTETPGVNVPENADASEQRRVLDALPVLVFLERAGTIVFANSEARQMLGLAEGEWVPRPVEEVLWGLFPGTAEPQTLLTATRQGSPFHATLAARSGRLFPVEGTYSLLDPELREAVIVAHPGGRERAPKTRLMQDVLASLPEAVAIEHGNHLLYTNPAFARMFGVDADEVSGNLRDLIVPETRLNEHATLLKAVDEQGSATMETVRATKAGELVDVSLQIAPLLVNGARVGYVHTFRDIGDRKETEAKLQYDAMHDVLTGLPNRALFLDRLKLALSRRARRADHSCGVLYLDLDRFKEINDALGHAAGDALLKGVAERLTAVLRPQDSAARLGGDEFAVLVESIFAIGDLETVAHRILGEMERPFEIFGRTIQAGASIGAAMAGPAHTAPEMLMREADLAMYRSKQAGGARLEVYDRHLEVAVNSQQERERELRTILERRLFEFRLQPIFRLADGVLEGLETSLCWRRPDGAVEDFRELMETAEDTGLSIALGRETLEAACRQLRAWQDALGQSCPYLTVNLTARQFYHADLLMQLSRAVAGSAADPTRLVLEVPESALNEDPDAAIATLQRVVDANVRVAMDAFGSSLAPLNHLLRLPLDMVKLDRKLTPTAASTGRHQAVLDALIRLGRSLGVHVVADGIESEAEISALLQMGCISGQGRLLSEPLPPEQALQLARTRAVARAPGF